MDATELEPTSGSAPRSSLSAFTSRVMAVDVACFRFLASLSVPKSVSLPLVVMVRIGDGYIWGVIALSLWLALPFAEVKAIVAHCALAIAVSLCIYFPIKFGMKRPRPYDNGMDVTPLVPPLDKYSFPSGHTMNNLAVGLTLAYHLPRFALPAMFFPVAMGLLRILFGVHYLSDILGGTLLGAVAFFIAKAVFPSFHL
ncbi:MAG: phosphoesterase PA-phosphatase related protein [Fibrobacteres bacterium]|nr:phosphoesterase PA-phosphatase related protein [Fibrobacterota bacterium]